jgi:hypothetical protein
VVNSVENGAYTKQKRGIRKKYNMQDKFVKHVPEAWSNVTFPR